MKTMLIILFFRFTDTEIEPATILYIAAAEILVEAWVGVLIVAALR
jgi:hypothetical protein